MVTMSGVWDRTVAVIAARRPVLIGLALSFLWLPGLVQSALRFAVLGAAATRQGPAAAPWLDVLGIVVTLIGVVGHLALVAAAGDAAADRREAVSLALRRFWPYVGIMLLLLAAAVVLALPLMVALFWSYPSIAAMEAGGPPSLSGGTALFVALYGLALVVVLVAVQARLLAVLAPVILHERLGLRSIPRAFGLTRGLTWRLIGVVLLFALVAGVVVIATQSVVGVVLRLLLGEGGQATALFLTAALVSLVACGLSVVVAAFTAQLYAAIRGGAAAGRWPTA